MLSRHVPVPMIGNVARIDQARDPSGDEPVTRTATMTEQERPTTSDGPTTPPPDDVLTDDEGQPVWREGANGPEWLSAGHATDEEPA
jgi:hypothetical protein